MTARSPLIGDTCTVDSTIKVSGKPVSSTFQVFSIDTWVAVNKVPKARLVIFDGSAAARNFPISNLPDFLPGKEIEIATGYQGKKQVIIFKGIIVRQGIEIDQTQGSKLVVDITDKALKMTLERKNAVFEKIKDSDLIGKLITNNGLKKKVTTTNTVHESVVQYYASDWDLMLTRAEMNSFVVIADAGTVTVEKPDTQQSPVLRVEYGESILDLQAEMDAATQYKQTAIKSFTWDVAAQNLIESGPSAVKVKEQGNVSSDTLADVFKVKEFAQQTGAPIEKTALQDWSSAELYKSRLSKIRGFVRFQGSALAQTGKTIELAGLGNRFNGTAFICAVHHNIRNGIWMTTTGFGLSSNWFASEAPEIAAPDNSGQLPAIKGLQTGIVKQVGQDKTGEYRVKVYIPLLQDKKKYVWARLGTFFASKKFGAFFFPEADDEVIVAFMNEDPRYPVIVGSVYNNKRQPPYPPDVKNPKKAIVTRSKLEISFDDENKIIEIKTPGKHIIKMDDKSGAVSIKDNNKNTISLSKGGIEIASGSNLKLTAKGNITIQAGANLTASAKVNASMEGVQVAHKAKAKFSAKGNAASELTSSGMLTIRGTLVKIN